MSVLPDMQVSDVVLDHPETAAVFRAFRIDFCCGGRVSLHATCRQRGVPLGSLIDALDKAIHRRHTPPEVDPRTLSTSALIDHIVERHHDYLRRTLPSVVALSAKVVRAHGDRGPKLSALHDQVEHLSAMLMPHLDHEEQILFPALLGLAGRDEAARELAQMHDDHVEVGRNLHRMRALADDYRVPAWGCVTYRTMIAELHALEADIHRHVHLESNVLMPRAAAATLT